MDRFYVDAFFLVLEGEGISEEKIGSLLMLMDDCAAELEAREIDKAHREKGGN